MLILDVLDDEFGRFEGLIAQFAAILASFLNFSRLIEAIFFLHLFEEFVF